VLLCIYWNLTLKEKPIYHRLIFQWLWNRFFEFELKMWQIIIILIIIVIINKLLRNKRLTKLVTDYKQTFSWNNGLAGKMTFFENKWTVRNIALFVIIRNKNEFEPSHGSQLSAKCQMRVAKPG
jgi:hypothetical protein